VEDRTTRPKERDRFKLLLQQIELKKQKKQEYLWLIKLSRVGSQGKVRPPVVEYFRAKNKNDFLMKVLQDTRGALSCDDNKVWIFMRFLAAKVLAYLPDPETRLQLYTLYHARDTDISTRILVAKSIYEIGQIFFD
jgi:hypothetical protein